MTANKKSKNEGRLFAIGDIHGCPDELAAILKSIAPTEGDTVVFVGDYVEGHHDAFLREVAPSVASGEIRYREDIRQGLENVPTCFAEMLRGDNFGKMLVQVADDPTL